MTQQDIENRRNDMQAEVQRSVSSVHRIWLRTGVLYYGVRILTLLFAAVSAFEGSLGRYFETRWLWDASAFIVLFLLLIDLGLRPGESQKGHNNYIGDAEILARAISLVDPADPSALVKLEQYNSERKRLMERHRLET